MNSATKGRNSVALLTILGLSSIAITNAAGTEIKTSSNGLTPFDMLFNHVQDFFYNIGISTSIAYGFLLASFCILFEAIFLRNEESENILENEREQEQELEFESEYKRLLQDQDEEIEAWKNEENCHEDFDNSYDSDDSDFEPMYWSDGLYWLLWEQTWHIA